MSTRRHFHSWIITVTALLATTAGPMAESTHAVTGEQTAKLMPNDSLGGDEFGRSVAISGNTAIIGAPADDDNAAD